MIRMDELMLMMTDESALNGKQNKILYKQITILLMKYNSSASSSLRKRNISSII